jgi:hypothetical protein
VGAKFGIELTPIPETVGFLGRDKELQDILTFLKSDKQVLEISGVPMNGKSRQGTRLVYLLFFVYLTALRKNIE